MEEVLVVDPALGALSDDEVYRRGQACSEQAQTYSRELHRRLCKRKAEDSIDTDPVDALDYAVEPPVPQLEAVAPAPPVERQRQYIRHNSGNGVVSADGLTFEKTSDDDWTCNGIGAIGWDSGVHEWSVKLVNSNMVSVGICREDISHTDCDLNNDKRMDLYCALQRFIVGDEVHASRCLPSRPKAGSVIGLRLDLDAKTLTVGIDGHYRVKPVLNDIPAGKWYPYFCIQDKGCQIKLITE